MTTTNANDLAKKMLRGPNFVWAKFFEFHCHLVPHRWKDPVWTPSPPNLSDWLTDSRESSKWLKSNNDCARSSAGDATSIRISRFRSSSSSPLQLCQRRTCLVRCESCSRHRTLRLLQLWAHFFSCFTHKAIYLLICLGRVIADRIGPA